MKSNLVVWILLVEWYSDKERRLMPIFIYSTKAKALAGMRREMEQEKKNFEDECRGLPKERRPVYTWETLAKNNGSLERRVTLCKTWKKGRKTNKNTFIITFDVCRVLVK